MHVLNVAVCTCTCAHGTLQLLQSGGRAPGTACITAGRDGRPEGEEQGALLPLCTCIHTVTKLTTVLLC